MTTEPTATRVVVSSPDELSVWGHDQLTANRLVTYLRRAHEDTAPGDEWEGFLDVGCCGDSLALMLRVEELDPEGTTRIDDEMTVESVEREGSVHGGWCAQSANGPVSSTAEQQWNAGG